MYRIQVVGETRCEIEPAAILAFDSELSSAGSNCGEAQGYSNALSRRARLSVIASPDNPEIEDLTELGDPRFARRN